jgi:hypothetical protein
MLRKFIVMGVTLILLAGCQALSAFQGPTATPLPMDAAVKQLMLNNLDSLNKKNLDAYMSTIDPQSPVYATTRQLMVQILASYDLKYTLESMDMIDKTDTTAKVRVVQTTKKVKGPAFRDNRIRMVDNLNKTSKGWLIYSTDIEDIYYFDQGTPSSNSANGNGFVAVTSALKTHLTPSFPTQAGRGT